MSDPFRARPCLVCEKPCRTEGQLCPACAAEGHYVTDDEVYVQINLTTTERPERADEERASE